MVNGSSLVLRIEIAGVEVCSPRPGCCCMGRSLISTLSVVSCPCAVSVLLHEPIHDFYAVDIIMAGLRRIVERLD